MKIIRIRWLTNIRSDPFSRPELLAFSKCESFFYVWTDGRFAYFMLSLALMKAIQGKVLEYEIECSILYYYIYEQLAQIFIDYSYLILVLLYVL